MDCLEWKHILNHCFEFCSICWFEVIWIGFMNSGARRCKVLGRRPLCAIVSRTIPQRAAPVMIRHWSGNDWSDWSDKDVATDLKPPRVISSIGSALDFVHSKGTRNSTVCAEPAEQTSWVIVIGFEFVEQKDRLDRGVAPRCEVRQCFAFKQLRLGLKLQIVMKILLSAWKNYILCWKETVKRPFIYYFHAICHASGADLFGGLWAGLSDGCSWRCSTGGPW